MTSSNSNASNESNEKGFKVITCISRKGGTGKSSSTINLGQAFRILGKNVAIIDADDQQSIAAWEKELKLKKYDTKYGDFFPDVISGANSASAISNIFHALTTDPEWQGSYDYILIDMAGHMSKIREGGSTKELYDAVIKNSDMLIMVNKPEIFCVNSNEIGCELMEERLAALGINKPHLYSLLNDVPTKKNASIRKSIVDLEELINQDKMWKSFDRVIERSPRVGASLTEGCTSFIPYRESIADSYYELTNEIVKIFEGTVSTRSLVERKNSINKLLKSKGQTA
jgi:cellulose biosynthesis protein BcsQ